MNRVSPKGARTIHTLGRCTSKGYLAHDEPALGIKHLSLNSMQPWEPQRLLKLI